MIECRAIFILKIVGLTLIGNSLSLMVLQDALLSETSIEYGIILFGVAASMEAIRRRRSGKRNFGE